MTPFEYLFIAHLVGDYLFQTKWMALHKHNKWLPLFVHVSIYTFVIGITAWLSFGGLSILQLGFVFITHLFLDRRTFVVWWTTVIMQNSDPSSRWLTIIVDQIFHLLVIAIILSFSFSFIGG
ncbi:DUF3307 domain-containing protein [Guptibacillus hwajinpoensis]|uniref:DUF3307 domain-containing protein n=1 Tax=Guptibacillus hwajinpoensis TaxID=208199 RepID=A0ABU0JYK9_9BACL|nr:DUF3307 domain-containing protein [Alkalihalobacillus hemicentroti]MDQ0482167.1 hypothetical protein [Alkalihalobacillus hemicentroti]